METHHHTLEAEAEGFLHHPDCFKHCLIGSLLSFIPIANIFALGYLYRLSQLRGQRQFNFLPWEGWGLLFIQGLVFMGFNGVFIGLPMLLAWIVKHVLVFFSFNILGFLANLPISLAAFIGPSLCVSALFRYHQTKSFRSLLNVKALIHPLLEEWQRVALATFCLLGFMGVLAPLYGVASFVGYAFYIYYMGGVLAFAKASA